MPTATDNRRLVYLPADEILPNPAQPRRCFDPAALEELAQSIAQHGILQPISVRCRQGKYELIAGERRLRAAKMAGLSSVPCIIAEVGAQESGLLALVENLQRRDLDFLEEAEGIARLIRVFSLSQEEAAKKLGKSPSAVANKLRLLRLPPEVLEGLRRENLTERHGRALLRLPDAETQIEAFHRMAKGKMTVSAAEAMVERMLSREKSNQRRAKMILKDVRIFMNTLNRGLEIMQRGGIDARVQQEERDEELILTISIPKQKGRG